MQFARGAVLVDEDVSTNQDGLFDLFDVDLPQVAQIQAQRADFDKPTRFGVPIGPVGFGEGHLEVGLDGPEQVLLYRTYAVDVGRIHVPTDAKHQGELDGVTVGGPDQVAEHLVLGPTGAAPADRTALLAGLKDALQRLEDQFKADGKLHAVAAVEQADKVDSVDEAILAMVVVGADQAVGVAVGLLADAVVDDQ